jgi:hypothetical protein
MRQFSTGGVVAMLLGSIAAGVANFGVAYLVDDVWGLAVSDNEVAASTYSINLFVGWVFFSAWFLTRADEEWKKVSDSVARGELETFLIEAPKQMPHTLRMLHVVIALLAILSFHLLPVSDSLATLFEINFGIGFFVVLTTLVLWDLDNPIAGVINVAGIPAEWHASLRAQRAGR